MRDQWTTVDEYLEGLLGPPDPALEAALRDSAVAGLPSHQVTASQGKLLQILAKIRGARAILEIGTLGAYSTIWLARGLAPGGRLISLEAEPKHADVARANVARAGLAEVVEIRMGRALDSLAALAAEGRGPFDVIFIDADKETNPEYLPWAIRLSRPGTVIVADNIVRHGRIVDADSADPSIVGLRRFHELVSMNERLSATWIQTVGSKGWDGLAIILVLPER